MLQNHRDYIHDKEDGKWQKVTMDMKDTANKPGNEQTLVGSGQKVHLKSGSGCYVGMGIYVRKIDAKYSEVVFTGVSNNAESDIGQEWAAPVDGELLWSQRLIKRTIVWRTDWLCVLTVISPSTSAIISKTSTKTTPVLDSQAEQISWIDQSKYQCGIEIHPLSVTPVEISTSKITTHNEIVVLERQGGTLFGGSCDGSGAIRNYLYHGQKLQKTHRL